MVASFLTIWLDISPGNCRSRHLVPCPAFSSTDVSPRVSAGKVRLTCSHTDFQEQNLGWRQTFLFPVLISLNTLHCQVQRQNEAAQGHVPAQSSVSSLLSCFFSSLHGHSIKINMKRAESLSGVLTLFCITICPSMEYVSIHWEMLSKTPLY